MTKGSSTMSGMGLVSLGCGVAVMVGANFFSAILLGITWVVWGQPLIWQEFSIRDWNTPPSRASLMAAPM